MKCEGNTLLIKYINTTENALNHINFHNFPLSILSKQTFFNLQSECFDKKSKYKAVSAQHIRPPSHVWRSLDPTKTFDVKKKVKVSPFFLLCLLKRRNVFSLNFFFHLVIGLVICQIILPSSYLLLPSLTVSLSYPMAVFSANLFRFFQKISIITQKIKQHQNT